MQEARRNEVQIDVCPKCRGVWLDRGELEKLLHSAREVEADYERERESWMRQPPAYQPQTIRPATGTRPLQKEEEVLRPV